MSSPIGQNAYFCCLRYGGLLNDNDIAFITKDFVCRRVQHAQSLDVILTEHCLLELLYVRQVYSSSPSPFTHDELEHAISHLSTGWQCAASMYLMYDFTI